MSLAGLGDVEEINGKHVGSSVVDTGPVELVAQLITEDPKLGLDQAAEVRALTGTTDGVAALVGPAGTGKTYTLGRRPHVPAIRVGGATRTMHL